MLKDIFTSQRQLLNHFFDQVDLTLAESVFSEFLKCQGMIVFTGAGKSGIIAEKLSKTMMSTGSKSLYLPSMSALHGDIGMLSSSDLLVIISKTGKSDEVLQLARAAKRKSVRTMAWVSSRDSFLNRLVDSYMVLPVEREICPFDLAPTTSTAVQLIFGDVMAVALMRAKKFSIDQYALNHPAGAIGKLIAQRVEDVMISGENLPVATSRMILKDAVVRLSEKRCGCLVVIDGKGEVEGIFTDGDLRRALEKHQAHTLSMTLSDVMSRSFISAKPDMLTQEALTLMEGEPKVMMLPVMEGAKLVGLIHMHHILGLEFSPPLEKTS